MCDFAPRRQRLLAVGLCFGLASAGALAQPTNPTVMSGSATFNTVGNTLTVTNTPNTLIHWDSFSIPAGTTTYFKQDAATSTVFNRVIGRSPSDILGNLTSEGRVVLINPNGITFGAGSSVNVSGLLASTLNISDNDLLNRNWNFTDPGNAGRITHAGTITSNNGEPVIMIGKSIHITDTGVINAEDGQIALSAGQRVRFTTWENPYLQLEIAVPENIVTIDGTLNARRGRIRIWDALVHRYTLIGDSGRETEIPLPSDPDRVPLEFAELDWEGEWLYEYILPIVAVQPRVLAERPTLTRTQLADSFAGVPPPGVQPVDQPLNSAARAEFYSQLLGKSTAEVNTYWNRLLTSSVAQRPKSFATEEETLRYLENTPNAVGYIDEKRVTKRLKVIHRFDEPAAPTAAQ